MNLTQKYIETSNYKQYYKEVVSKLDKAQKEKLEILLQKMDNSGAKKPLGWALSEITEDKAQFGRFLFLKGLFKITHNIKGNMSFADDVDGTYEENIFKVHAKLKNSIGEDALNNFLKSYTKGVMWQVVDQIDEGNYNTIGEPMWLLKETTNNKLKGRTINGLHEDFNEFEDELK